MFRPRLACTVGLCCVLLAAGCAQRVAVDVAPRAAPAVILPLATETSTPLVPSPSRTTSTSAHVVASPAPPLAALAATAVPPFVCPSADGVMQPVEITVVPSGLPVASGRITLTVQARLISQADRRLADAAPSHFEATDPATGLTHSCPASIFVDTDLGDTLRANLLVTVPAGLRPVWAVPQWQRVADLPANGQERVVGWPVELVADRPAVYRLVLVPAAGTCYPERIHVGISDTTIVEYLDDRRGGIGYYGDSGVSMVIGEPGRPGWTGGLYGGSPASACTQIPTTVPSPWPTATPTSTPASTAPSLLWPTVGPAVGA